MSVYHITRASVPKSPGVSRGTISSVAMADGRTGTVRNSIRVLESRGPCYAVVSEFQDLANGFFNNFNDFNGF